jgi:hypothetical protein
MRRYSEAFKADVRRMSPLHRQRDVTPICEGTRRLERRRQLHGGTGDRWRQRAQDANAKPVLTMAEQKELESSVPRTNGRSSSSRRTCSARRRPWRRRQHC